MDTELVMRAQRGDTGAFTRLAGELTPPFLSVAHRILRDVSIAEDATQQALFNAWQKLPQLREPERFEAWAYRLLVRACYDEGRRTRRWAPALRLVPTVEPVATDEFGVVLDRDELERAFRTLSIEQRTVVVLRHYRHLSLEEMSAVLGVPVGTVASRLHYAMRALRSAVEADARPAQARSAT